MVSGRAARFHSPEELLAFFAQVLGPLRAQPAAELERRRCRTETPQMKR
jgi:hypothetical protein